VRTALVAVGVAGVGVVLLVGRLTRGNDASVPSVNRVQVRAELSADGHRFGDLVPVSVDVLVPRRLVDPGSVRLEASYAPYRPATPTRLRRVDGSETTLIRYRLALQCLESACMPNRDGAALLLPDAVVRFRVRDRGPAELRVPWPQLQPRSRLGPLDAGLLAWHDGMTPLPEQDYRVPPRLLGVLVGVLALACALGAAGLLVPQALARLPDRRTFDRRSLLERALAAVLIAASGGDTAERRRALDLLARELRAGSRRREARLARRLAWSQRTPASVEMERLVASVERSEP
jgi:hypothetical protein